jgi:hypothetical protein
MCRADAAYLAATVLLVEGTASTLPCLHSRQRTGSRRAKEPDVEAHPWGQFCECVVVCARERSGLCGQKAKDCLFALFHYGYVRDGVDRTVEGRVLRRTEAGKGVSRRRRLRGEQGERATNGTKVSEPRSSKGKSEAFVEGCSFARWMEGKKDYLL